MLCLVTQLCLTLWHPMDCSPPGSSVHGNAPGKKTGVGFHALLQGIFLTQGSQCRSPALQVDSLPSEPELIVLISIRLWVESDTVRHSVMSNSLWPMDCSLPGSSVHGILQARLLEWVAMSFSGDLPDPGIELMSPTLQADSLPSEGKVWVTWEQIKWNIYLSSSQNT